MNVERQTEGAAAVIVVNGQVDLHTSPELRSHLRAALSERRDPIVADLSGVSFIDSSGLATLVEALQGVANYGGRLRLVGLPPPVRKLFELSKLTSIFEILATREEALEA